ncbi:ABATE domain-containing protein [Amycolatopsis sp. CA-128772]|uniref:CGNR zinc finger domain-containing protein n=1 Tax=Amycolatopsis sp. CA-128772 TaxID=2073159 RepID=UPI000CD23337|nr:CGNR zinc finger domain-containing protein [Amycolatopsis sp. CA-128772]
MIDACYSGEAVQTAVDLANTWKPVKGEDALETVEQLRDFLGNHPAAVPAPGSAAALTRADLAEAHVVRETVRAVLERAGTDPGEAMALLNEGLRRSHATPVLRRDHDRWWIEVAAGADQCAAHLAATTLGALASVIATLGPARLGVCAGSNCRGTYVDLSRNGSKEYCTRACAHRASVAAYRKRRSPR